MDGSVALWLLITSITSTFFAVGSVVVSWREASRSTQARKWLRKQVMTQTSDAKLAEVRADLAELASAFSKLAKTQQRLSSRQGLADVKERQANAPPAPPPPGTPKAQLRLHYGLQGKSPTEIAEIARRGVPVTPPTED